MRWASHPSTRVFGVFVRYQPWDRVLCMPPPGGEAAGEPLLLVAVTPQVTNSPLTADKW
jgi:hypothetical protein